MAILGEALTIVVFHVKVDPHPAADLGPVPVFCVLTQVQDRVEATSLETWPYSGASLAVSRHKRARVKVNVKTSTTTTIAQLRACCTCVSLANIPAGNMAFVRHEELPLSVRKFVMLLKKSCAFDCDTELKSDFTVIVHVAMESWAARRSMLFPS